MCIYYHLWCYNGIMSKHNEKIGHLISRIRQERGLTQAEFARRMGTSQSAINRIEQGKQNLSLETIARISSALGKDIISLNPKVLNFEINGGKELHGEIEMKSSKNATVAILAGSLLNKGVTVIENAPRIEEVFRLLEVLESLGVQVRWIRDKDLEIKPPETLQFNNINAEAATKTRSIIMFIGSMMHYSNKFSIPFAGGCHLGKRSVFAHKEALEKFGVKSEVENNQ